MARQHAVVDLESDSDDEYFLAEEIPQIDPQYAHIPQYDGAGDLDHGHAQPRQQQRPALAAADEYLDLTHIPDVDVPPSNLGSPARVNGARRSSSEPLKYITEAACLQMVLDVLPDISIGYALSIIRAKTDDVTRSFVHVERIITQLLDDASYPKEADEAKQKKRKRTDDEDWLGFDRALSDDTAQTYYDDALELLKDEFLSIPVRHIMNVLQDKKTLYRAYITLEEQYRNYGRIANRFSKIGKPRTKRGAEPVLIERGSQIPKELHAVKRKVESEMVKRHRAAEAEQAEEDNLKRAQETNEMGECVCCFGDVPLNRMVGCDGDLVHLYCMDCPKRQIETLIGQSRCQITCFGVENCGGTFTRKQLQQVLDEKTFDRLEHLQQQAELAAAGLDFLAECPFCDFKMECPPIEIDKEFRCQSTKCRKISCRLCQKETHIPLNCEEAKEDGHLTMRHVVEEAMSAALIRQCNQCKHPFVKEYGCNKMSCTHCRNVQCYVCSKNVVNYEHFGEPGSGRCPLHENVEDRHAKEVKAAAEEAMAKVRAENPDLSDADLMIQVSDRVKKIEDARRNNAQNAVRDFPWVIVDNALQPRRPAGAAAGARPQPPPQPAAQPARAGPIPPAPFLQLPPFPALPVQAQGFQYVPDHHYRPHHYNNIPAMDIYDGQPAHPPLVPLGPPMQFEHNMPFAPPNNGPAQAFQPVVYALNHLRGGNRPIAPDYQPGRLRDQHGGEEVLPQRDPAVDAEVLQHRLNQLQQVQNHMAHAQLERRARILELQRDNLAQQRALLMNDMEAFPRGGRRPEQGQPQPRRPQRQ